MGMAASCLNINPDAFFDLTPRAFQVMMKAYNNKAEQEAKIILESARLTGWLAARPHFSKQAQKQFWHPQLYHPFRWDEEIKQAASPIPTNENMERARQWLLSDN